MLEYVSTGVLFFYGIVKEYPLRSLAITISLLFILLFIKFLSHRRKKIYKSLESSLQ